MFFRALPQRRNVNYVEPVVEIASKLFSLNHLFEALVSAGHYSNIDSAFAQEISLELRLAVPDNWIGRKTGAAQKVRCSWQSLAALQ